MIKIWKLLSIWIVVGVCLALMLVPAPIALAQADCGIEVQPAMKQVGFNETFDVTVTINNSNALPLNAVQAFLSFDSSMLQVNSITYAGTPFTQVITSPDWDNTTGEISSNTGTPPGTNTSATAPLVMTINMSSKSTSGTTIIGFQKLGPTRETKVYGEGLGNVLNWTRVANGTVLIGPAFNLTVTSNGCCPITVGALGAVAANSSQLFIVPCPSVTLTAGTSACCDLVNWTVNGTFASGNPIVVTGAANTSHTATATCSVPQYNLTMAVTGSGTTTPVPGTTTRSCQEVVPITATADPGWQFINWTTTDMSEIADPNDNSTTVTMDKNKTVTANFAQTYTLTMAVTGTGTTTPSGSSMYANGTVVDINATPGSGWHFVNWTTTGNISEIAAPTAASTTVIVDQNKTVTAHFAINQYNLTINSTTGGNVTTPGEGTFGLYNHGTVVNLIATPDTDYAFVHWSGDNGTIADVNSSTTTINMTGNYSIMAHFGPQDFSVLPTPLTFTTDEGENPPSQTLEICNTGTGTLDWSLTDNAAWLSGSPTSGSLGEGECENVVVSVDVAGMGAGDYSATITFTGSLELQVPVSLRIVSAMPDMLVGPAQLSASALSISPQQVQPGQDVTISINVANTGGETGSYNAVLYINGVVEDSQSVSVAAGISKNVIFTVSKSQAGVYDVALAGQTGQFEVVGGGGWFGGGGLGTGGIIAIVVVVIILIGAVVFILRGTTRPE